MSATCATCGNPFDYERPPGPGRPRKHCDKCRRIDTRQQRKPPAVKREVACEVCGKTAHTHAPNWRFCSQKCKDVFWNQSASCSLCEATMWRCSSSTEAPICRPCRSAQIEHGTVTRYKRHGCRCDLCRAAWSASNAKYDRARRAMMRGARTANKVDPVAIYERDGWLCGICELPVDPAERWPSPGAPTLDHIIPVSRGGIHDDSNLQLAHFYCNGVKGNRMEGSC